ncbi:MAG: ATP-binding protein [bacterium]|nr:ATP-binding protein [bacterium]
MQHDLANILIVDDRKENLVATEKVLKHLPATLFAAASGNEALSLMLRHKFAVVILDVQMPGMDGFETASLMQEEETMRGTPIIFATAISKEDRYASRAGDIGAVDYIFKPINPDILRSKVKVYLDLYIQREQIMKLNAGLQRSNEELEKFAYICSHDLKAPLRAIQNLSQWITEELGDALNGKSAEYMEELRKRVRRMEKLLDDTLEYARLGSKTQSSAGDEVEGRALAEDVVSMTSPPKGFNMIIGSGFSNIRLAAMPLQQVLYNLVNNAIKHHENPHGSVWLDVEEVGNSYLFTVKDDGPGIAPEHHARIFEMFQTLKPRDQKEGSGMGLAIVKKILANCGGDVSVHSHLGEGATFRVTWPKSGGAQ